MDTVRSKYVFSVSELKFSLLERTNVHVGKNVRLIVNVRRKEENVCQKIILVMTK